MAISVNPMTHVIYVPKADLTLQQSLPEVRELDLNAFRLWLRAWEDDDEGMWNPAICRMTYGCISRRWYLEM